MSKNKTKSLAASMNIPYKGYINRIDSTNGNEQYNEYDCGGNEL